MSKRLFVGNVNSQVSEEQLERLFSAAGEVVKVSIPLDRESARPRGFAFVEFAQDEQAKEALETLDNEVLEGRRIRLRAAFEERRREARRGHRGRPEDLAPEIEDLERDGSRGWRGFGEDDYSTGRRGRRRKRGKHGVDRMRGRGTRRVIE